jgi:hypothetical protein
MKSTSSLSAAPCNSAEVQDVPTQKTVLSHRSQNFVSNWVDYWLQNLGSLLDKRVYLYLHFQACCMPSKSPIKRYQRQIAKSMNLIVALNEVPKLIRVWALPAQSYMFPWCCPWVQGHYQLCYPWTQTRIKYSTVVGTAVNIKIGLFWCFIPCSLINRYQNACCHIFECFLCAGIYGLRIPSM